MYKIGLFYAASAACNINVKTKLTDRLPLERSTFAISPLSRQTSSPPTAI